MQTKRIENTNTDSAKYWKLAVSLLFDAVGMITYLIPGVGEVGDLIWAPISAMACFMLYRGKLGAFGGMAAATEEVIPFTDIIPSLTLVWVARYVLSGGD
jgi:hypothetical protein